MGLFFLYLSLIFLFAEKLFYLPPSNEVIDIVVDIGSVLILIGLFDALFRARDFRILRNPISLLIVVYFIMVCLQISLAMIYYQQSLIGGFIGARSQVYYLSFFLFLLRLDDIKKMIGFLEVLSVIGSILVILAVINYVGPKIFNSQFAEGVGTRAGVVRAWFPGMMLLSFVGLWQYCRSIVKETYTTKSGASMILFLAAHFFRQTRTRTITLCFLMGSMLILNKKFKHSTLFVVIGGIAIGIAQVFMEENILIASFESAFEDLSEDSGTWGARTTLARAQMEQFLEHPVLGSGKSALAGSAAFRAGSEIGRVGDLLEQSANVHAGYSSWFLSYGLLGGIWLVCFVVCLFFLGRRGFRDATGEEKALLMFGLSYVGFVIITNISLNHLQFPVGIIYVCFAAAIIVRTLSNQESNQRQMRKNRENGTKI